MKARYNNDDVSVVQTMYKAEKKRNGKTSKSPPKVTIPDRSSSRE